MFSRRFSFSKFAHCALLIFLPTAWCLGSEPQPCVIPDSDEQSEQVASADTTTSEQSEFIVLFDGTSLDGWKQSGNWEIEDGAIARKGGGGSLVFDRMKVPDDFELRFEWKVGQGSNSGVYYRPGQYEYQILDNKKHRDGKNPRTSAAALYFCVQPSEDKTRPAGQWNEGRIVCKGSRIQHWLNGTKVVDFDYADSDYAFNVDLLRKRGGNVEDRGAKLSLQDHGDPVWYKNIRMRRLRADEKLDLKPIVPAEISDEVLAAEKAKLDGIVARREKQAAEKKQQ